MFTFIDNVREELLGEFIDILDLISIESLNLYDRITGNLILILRTNFRKPRCGDKFIV